MVEIACVRAELEALRKEKAEEEEVVVGREEGDISTDSSSLAHQTVDGEREKEETKMATVETSLPSPSSTFPSSSSILLLLFLPLLTPIAILAYLLFQQHRHTQSLQSQLTHAHTHIRTTQQQHRQTKDTLLTTEKALQTLTHTHTQTTTTLEETKAALTLLQKEHETHTHTQALKDAVQETEEALTSLRKSHTQALHRRETELKFLTRTHTHTVADLQRKIEELRVCVCELTNDKALLVDMAKFQSEEGEKKEKKIRELEEKLLMKENGRE